jgi:hypothetical protein
MILISHIGSRPFLRLTSRFYATYPNSDDLEGALPRVLPHTLPQALPGTQRGIQYGIQRGIQYGIQPGIQQGSQGDMLGEVLGGTLPGVQGRVQGWALHRTLSANRLALSAGFARISCFGLYSVFRDWDLGSSCFGLRASSFVRASNLGLRYFRLAGLLTTPYSLVRESACSLMRSKCAIEREMT